MAGPLTVILSLFALHTRLLGVGKVVGVELVLLLSEGGELLVVLHHGGVLLGLSLIHI